jgi:hypothetical protein
MFHSDDNISLFVTFVNIFVGFGNLFQRIASIDDGVFPRLNQIFEEIGVITPVEGQ